MSSKITKIDVPEDERRAIFAYLKRQDPGSKKCFDCSNKAPTWASIHFGVYVCIDCSGRHRSMGTHITFVQSTDIDQWTVENLRYMKHGGNAAAANVLGEGLGSMRKYLDDRGNLLPLPANYKERLRSLVDQDRATYPDRLYIEALEETRVTAAAAAAQAEEDELDWLDSQISGASSKPKPKAAPAPAPRVAAASTPAILPGIGRTASASSTASRTTTSSAILSGSTTPTTSRATSSSTLGSVAKKTSTLGATKASGLGATKTGTKLGAKKGLGATKAGASSASGAGGGFEEAARKAQEEEVRRLAEEKEREAKAEAERIRLEQERAKAEEARKKAGIATPPIAPATPGGATSAARTSLDKQAGGASSNPEMERLGMGVRKMGFGSIGAGASAAAPKKKTTAEEDSRVARERFGNQKAISSDMYFERNDYDPTTVSAAQTRLQDFKGATSISSNQYFGREEQEGGEDGQGYPSGGGSGGGYLTSDNLSNLESSARDALTRVMNNPDVQNLGETLRATGLKVSDYLANFSADR